MYADRDRYVGDPGFVTVPVEGLLDPAYVAVARALIGDPAGPPPVAGHAARRPRWPPTRRWSRPGPPTSSSATPPATSCR